ncbi:MAG: tol-pal system-associated acyl-CoA thioesterase [Methylococcaceae bacterium]|nr:tol-pal system-associated acyl-CoA thioesterase [Methylococcaceae bacterium]MCI0732648.1 tol-pal system-associated acyl-CoA thioesterase [Methylococcaceae bacterium]
MKNFQWPVRVYYEDTDAGGVVYYANYLKFYERARTERLRALGFEQDRLRRDTGLVFAVRSVQVDYLRPALFNDELLVSAEVRNLKRASVEFNQEITRCRFDSEPELLSRAVVRIVSLDIETFTPITIPDAIRERMNDDC